MVIDFYVFFLTNENPLIIEILQYAGFFVIKSGIIKLNCLHNKGASESRTGQSCNFYNCKQFCLATINL